MRTSLNVNIYHTSHTSAIDISDNNAQLESWGVRNNKQIGIWNFEISYFLILEITLNPTEACFFNCNFSKYVSRREEDSVRTLKSYEKDGFTRMEWPPTDDREFCTKYIQEIS